MVNDLEPLEPPDLARCQTEIRERTPFALGGTHRTRRCARVPTVVVVENAPGKDGRVGSMSLCEECLVIAKRQLGERYLTVARIKSVKAVPTSTET